MRKLTEIRLGHGFNIELYWYHQCVMSSDPSDGWSWIQPFRGWATGSVGHPELCRRPCIYFAAGQCRNSADCNFCRLIGEDQRGLEETSLLTYFLT